MTRDEFLRQMDARCWVGESYADALELAGIAPWSKPEQPPVSRSEARDKELEQRLQVERDHFKAYCAACESQRDEARKERDEAKAALAARKPAPAPEITRERLADDLRASWFSFGDEPNWLRVADRAIELLAADGADGDRETAYEARATEWARDVVLYHDMPAEPGDDLFATIAKAVKRLTRERDEARSEAERLRAQIDELASFIIAEVPGEPSQSQGAIDTAIRVIRALLTAPPRPLGLPSVEELAEMIWNSFDEPPSAAPAVWKQIYASIAARLHAALLERGAKPEARPVLDPERLARAIAKADDQEAFDKYDVDFARAVIAAYGAVALPPVPQGDEGPKAMQAALEKTPPLTEWMHTRESIRADYRRVWAEAVRLLRPDAAPREREGKT